MDQKEALRISVQNVRSMVNNSILLLRDVDLLLSKAGFTPLFGNTLGCEPSKNINQSYDQPSSFFPPYMSRFYYRNETGAGAKLLCVNVQFYHHLWDEFQPCILAGLCKLSSKGNKPQHWWMKYYAFEFDTNERIKPDRSIYHREDEDASVSMWGIELQELAGIEDIKKEITDRLIEEYERQND